MNLAQFFKFVIYGGTSNLKALEKGILDFLIESLNAEDASAMREQIKNLSIIQREHDCRMILFFINKAKCQALADDSENKMIASISYTIGAQKLTSKVFTHRGWLSSIETTSAIPKTALAEAPSDLKFSSKPGKLLSASLEINETEHGD